MSPETHDCETAGAAKAILQDAVAKLKLLSPANAALDNLIFRTARIIDNLSHLL